jgi:hypothetical protein
VSEETKNDAAPQTLSDDEIKSAPLGRRSFLKKTGISAMAVGLVGVTGCPVSDPAADPPADVTGDPAADPESDSDPFDAAADADTSDTDSTDTDVTDVDVSDTD